MLHTSERGIAEGAFHQGKSNQIWKSMRWPILQLDYYHIHFDGMGRELLSTVRCAIINMTDFAKLESIPS